jgi:hypothetical protein
MECRKGLRHTTTDLKGIWSPDEYFLKALSRPSLAIMSPPRVFGHFWTGRAYPGPSQASYSQEAASFPWDALQMKGRWESNINVWLSFMYFQQWNWYFQNRIIMFSFPVPTLIYLWEIYIFPGSVCLFCCREICGPILGIYKSLTDTWMWKLGLRPRYSQKRSI